MYRIRLIFISKLKKKLYLIDFWETYAMMEMIGIFAGDDD